MKRYPPSLARARITMAALTAALLLVPGAATATVPGGDGRIAFQSERAGNLDVWTMDDKGGDLVNLTGFSPGSEFQPAWSPDGLWLAFVGVGGGPSPSTLNFDIFVMDKDATELTNLTQSLGVEELFPSWSPDGQQLVFDAIPTGGSTSQIVRTSVDGTKRTKLTSAGFFDTQAEYSPDGTQIAFCSNRGGVADVWVMDADGSSLTNVSSTTDDDCSPSWSPDGAQIAFDSNRSGSFDIWLMDADGGNQTQVTSFATQEVFPRFTPEGDRILFHGDRASASLDVWRIDADGTDPQRLTNNAAIDALPAQQPVPAVDTVGLVDPAQGIWQLLDAVDNITEIGFGNPGDFPFVGDWDCDGDETPGLYRQSDGFVYLRNSNTTGVADREFFFGNPGDIPLAGDFNGDGCDTVSIYRPSEGVIYVINELGEGNKGLGAADKKYAFGDLGDKPFVGDFDGDGIDTVGLHRESTGRVYFRNSQTTGIADADFIFGNPGDRLVAGDWNGNGVDSPALFRPSDLTFYFRFTNTQGNADLTISGLGEPDWLPVGGYLGLE